jgi:hypothetical protein
MRRWVDYVNYTLENRRGGNVWDNSKLQCTLARWREANRVASTFQTIETSRISCPSFSRKVATRVKDETSNRNIHNVVCVLSRSQKSKVHVQPARHQHFNVQRSTVSASVARYLVWLCCQSPNPPDMGSAASAHGLRILRRHSVLLLLDHSVTTRRCKPCTSWKNSR